MEKVYKIKRAYSQNLPHEEIQKLYEEFEDKDIEIESNKSTLLHMAANYADHKTVEYLLGCGVRANITNEYGYTPLRSLCNLRDVTHEKWEVTDDDVYKTTCLLLDAKVSVFKKDESGNTCAIVAAERGMYPMLKALVEKGAKIDFPNRSNMTPLHMACDYVRFALSSLSYAKDDLVGARKRASEPTGSANLDRIYQEDIIRIEKKLDENIKVVDDYFDIVKLLVENGMDTDAKDNTNSTALDYAIKYDAKKIGAYLKKGTDDLSEDELIAGGMNLHEAAHKDDVEAINALMRLGANVAEISDADKFKGMTPLAVACHNLNTGAVETLIAHGADPNLKSGENAYTPMQYLLRYSHLSFPAKAYKEKGIQKIMKILMDAGLNINDTINDNYDIALMQAAATIAYNRINHECVGNIVFDILIRAGADVNITNKEGKNALMILLHEDLDGENYLIDLLENNARIDTTDINSNTPLMYAVTNRRQAAAKTFAELLAQFGDIKLDAVNNDGKTAVDLATDLGYEEVVKLLLTL